jgi:hypothetical protein
VSRLYASAPGRPLLVTEATGPVRRTIVKEPQASSEAHREFIVPIVAALQGGDGYATEAIVEAEHDTRVTFTLMPSGAMKTHAVRAREPLILNDVVHESFGVMTTGWLRVRSEQPVRAAFWFVNRGRAVAASVPVITEVPSLPQRIAGGEKLWVLNPWPGATKVRVNGREVVIEGGALRQFGTEAMNEVEGAVVAFTSMKMPDGNTVFGTPASRPADAAASRAAALASPR